VKTVYKDKALPKIQSYYDLTVGKKYLSAAVALAGKAAEHSRLPRPFCYFLGQCQKVKRKKTRHPT
jgi:hypothetical protein